MVRPERVERPTYWFVASCSSKICSHEINHLRENPHEHLLFDVGSLTLDDRERRQVTTFAHMVLTWKEAFLKLTEK